MKPSLGPELKVVELSKGGEDEVSVVASRVGVKL